MEKRPSILAAPKPAVAVTEEEQTRLMKERLAKLMGKAMETKATQPVAKTQLPAKPRRTLFEKMEERKAPQVQPAAQAPVREEGKPLTPFEERIDEENKRGAELQAERAKKLKEEIAKRVSKRVEDEEKRKKEDSLEDEIKKEMQEE